MAKKKKKTLAGFSQRGSHILDYICSVLNDFSFTSIHFSYFCSVILLVSYICIFMCGVICVYWS